MSLTRPSMGPSLTPMATVPHHPKVPDLTDANYMKRWAFAKVAEESQDGSASTEVVGTEVVRAASESRE